MVGEVQQVVESQVGSSHFDLANVAPVDTGRGRCLLLGVPVPQSQFTDARSEREPPRINVVHLTDYKTTWCPPGESAPSTVCPGHFSTVCPCDHGGVALATLSVVASASLVRHTALPKARRHQAFRQHRWSRVRFSPRPIPSRMSCSQHPVRRGRRPGATRGPWTFAVSSNAS